MANNVTSGTAIIVDLTTGSVATSVSVGQSPGGVAITPDGATAWVSNKNTVSVITLASTSVTDTYTAGCVATTLYDRLPNEICGAVRRNAPRHQGFRGPWPRRNTPAGHFLGEEGGALGCAGVDHHVPQNHVDRNLA